MMIRLLLIVLGLASVVSADKKVTFRECTMRDTANPFFHSSAVFTYNPSGIGGTVQWELCSKTPDPLLHVDLLRLEFINVVDNSTVASHPIRICSKGGNECIDQLQASTRPSCMKGSKELPWLIVEPEGTTAQLLLVESSRDKPITHFCPE
jgi:hypothetical protein